MKKISLILILLQLISIRAFCPTTVTFSLNRKKENICLYKLDDEIDKSVSDNPNFTTLADDEKENRFTQLPRHQSNQDVNVVLDKVQEMVSKFYRDSLDVQSKMNDIDELANDTFENEKVYANSYVDLAKVDTVGFDYDYTLVTYKDELLDLIYSMALNRLVHDFQYPLEMLDSGMKFDPMFSIRGLAVDRETAWICHLSYTHKVTVAYEGRSKVSRQKLMKEYSGKRALNPEQRKKRLKPLNDLFSMAECCLIADVVQFFKDRNMPFCSRNAVSDILGAIGSTHISGDFHRIVAADPEKYFEPRPHLKEVLVKLKESGKRLIFVSNSPFWYVDAGMKYVIGDNWRKMWDVVIVSAGKPSFYTESLRPFRLVDSETGRVQFKKVERLEPGNVYSAGCLLELTKCLDWVSKPANIESDSDLQGQFTGGSSLQSPNVLYIGDSLFADLVDAKRNFGWTTAAVTPEVGIEDAKANRVQFANSQTVIDILLYSLREIQDILGNGPRSEEDIHVMDKLERIIALWREEQNRMLGNPFGSVFRAKYVPSLFAHSLRRYCDLYMSNVSALRHYSPQHRFYPEDARLLSHEVQNSNFECWGFDELKDLKN